MNENTLLQALKNNNLEAVKNADKKIKENVLIEVIKDKDIDSLKLLLASGVDVKSDEALMVASAKNYTEIVKLLIEHGADANINEPDDCNEMIDLYNSIGLSDGHPTYLSDGVWLYPDGSLKDEKN